MRAGAVGAQPRQSVPHALGRPGERFGRRPGVTSSYAPNAPLDVNIVNHDATVRPALPRSEVITNSETGN